MGNVVITDVGPLYSLEEVKAHLVVDMSDDDAIIESYMAAAETSVLQYCNVSLVPLGKEAVFKVAAMMYVAAMYEKRDGGDGLPQGARLLLNPYRWLRV